MHAFKLNSKQYKVKMANHEHKQQISPRKL